MIRKTIFALVLAIAALVVFTPLASAQALDVLSFVGQQLTAPSSLLLLATVPAAGVLSDTAADTAAAQEAAAAAAATAAAEAAKSTAASAAKKVKARVLFAGSFGAVDEVVVLDPAAAKAGVAAGELDTDKSAVAYAEGLAKPVAA